MKNLSTRLYGTLHYIRSHDVTLETLQLFHGNTLGALLQNEYIERHGSGAKARVALSALGEAAWASYHGASPSKRSQPGPLTERCAERCAALLRVTRMARVFQMPPKTKGRAAS